MPGKSPHRWRGVYSRPYTRRMSTTVRKTRNYQNTPRQWPRLQTPDPCGQRENGEVLSSRAYLLFTMSWNKPSSPWASTETDLFHRNVLHEPTVAHLGGARRDRTDDFLLAKQALSQLSYGPFSGVGVGFQVSKRLPIGCTRCLIPDVWHTIPDPHSMSGGPGKI